MSIIATEMKNLAVANGILLSTHAWEAVGGGPSSVERACSFGRRLPGVEKVLLLLQGRADEPAPPAPTFVQVLRRPLWTLGEMIEVLREHAEGCEELFYFFADCPLLDPTLAERMFGHHRQYLAEYTFADGYPYGLAPEILKARILEPLRALVSEEVISRDSLFELIKKDINAFDLETEISPQDLRLLRVRLAADTRRNQILLDRVMGRGAKDSPGVMQALTAHPEDQRTLPAFFSVQIVEGCPQLCSYCPYPKLAISETGKKGEMSLEGFQTLLAQVSSFCEDAVVSVSLWGEPAFHSRIEELMSSVLSLPRLRLVVETSGIGWKRPLLEKLARGLPRPPEWILSLDAQAQAVYSRLRGEGYKEARECAQALIDLFPGNAHVQAVRMKENEEDLEEFYRSWKKKTEGVIIQKYDSFCGLLPDRRVADLSPLKRFPCWHLKRDLAVRMDGTAALCREDLEGKQPLGNIFRDGLEAVWRAMEPFYLSHLRSEYPGICGSCDEYYTFNF